VPRKKRRRPTRKWTPDERVRLSVAHRFQGPPDWHDVLRLARREDVSRLKFARALWSRYGLSVRDYATMLQDQEHRCAVCCRNLKHGIGGAAVDHNHKTNVVRGILCWNCNYRLIPRLERAVPHLRRALVYLGIADNLKDYLQ